jgi:hypothetical protein
VITFADDIFEHKCITFDIRIFLKHIKRHINQLPFALPLLNQFREHGSRNLLPLRKMTPIKNRRQHILRCFRDFSLLMDILLQFLKYLTVEAPTLRILGLQQNGILSFKLNIAVYLVNVDALTRCPHLPREIELDVLICACEQGIRSIRLNILKV